MQECRWERYKDGRWCEDSFRAERGASLDWSRLLSSCPRFRFLLQGLFLSAGWYGKKIFKDIIESPEFRLAYAHHCHLHLKTPSTLWKNYQQLVKKNSWVRA